LKVLEIIEVSLDGLQPNKWNPNVMDPVEYEALKKDMHIHGVGGIDPLLVSPQWFFYGNKESFKHYVIVDGEHRWKAAKELTWKQIRCEVQQITQADAKALCYRRNRERGTIDPIKEAHLFKSEVDDAHMTQAEIAGKYGLNQATVSQRLSLLKLPTEIIEKVQSIPRGIIQTSHLEPIATLAPADQKAVGMHLIREARTETPYTVRQIQEEVDRVKRDRKQEADLARALETAKYPKCPACKGKPVRISYKGLPWVNCDNFHSGWNLQSGKTEYSISRQRVKNEKGEVRSSVLRSVHTVKDLKDLFIRHAKEVVPKVDIEHVKVSGELDNSRFSFDLDSYGKALHVSWSHGGTHQWFSAEDHPYRTGEKTCVHTGNPDAVEKVREFIDNAFHGKLGVESKRLKIDKKTSAEVIHQLHSGTLEADKIRVTENPEETLAADEARRKAAEED
jgi:ParB/RepB/Spo0J family partition protein